MQRHSEGDGRLQRRREGADLYGRPQQSLLVIGFVELVLSLVIRLRGEDDLASYPADQKNFLQAFFFFQDDLTGGAQGFIGFFKILFFRSGF